MQYAIIAAAMLPFSAFAESDYDAQRAVDVANQYQQQVEMDDMRQQMQQQQAEQEAQQRYRQESQTQIQYVPYSNPNPPPNLYR